MEEDQNNETPNIELAEHLYQQNDIAGVKEIVDGFKGKDKAAATISECASELIYDKLAVVTAAYQEGSIITVDNSISVFAGLCKANADYEKIVLPIIINHLQKCKPREVSQHAERASICFSNENAEEFINVLEKWKADLTTTGQTCIRRLMKKLYSL